MGHANMMSCQDLDLAVRKPDAVCEQYPRRIKQTKGLQRFDGTHVEALQGFLHIEFAFIAVGMKTGLIMPADIDDALIGFRRGIKHMLQSHPDVDPAARAAMPFLDQDFICIERFEIIMVRMLGDIRDEDRAYAELPRGPGAAMHVTPHIDDGSRPG